MELEAMRKFLQDHLEGVVIRLVNGERLVVPRRDVVSFGAPRELLRGRREVRGTSFLHFEIGEVASMRLVNAMLGAVVVPLRRNGNGHRRRGKRSKSR